jgi:hypothetical protein
MLMATAFPGTLGRLCFVETAILKLAGWLSSGKPHATVRPAMLAMLGLPDGIGSGLVAVAAAC